MKNCDNKWNYNKTLYVQLQILSIPWKCYTIPDGVDGDILQVCAGLLLAPAEGFGRQQRLFWPIGQKKGFFALKKKTILGYNFVFSSNHSNLSIYDFVSSAKGIFKLRIGFLKGGNSQLLQLLQEMQQWYNATFLDRFNFF